LQDRKALVLDNLDIIKRSYVSLALLKEREREAQDAGNYEFLYELSENERVLIENINGCLKLIVPDLLALRGDDKVRALLTEIDGLHEAVIAETLRIRNELKESIAKTGEKLERLNIFPKPLSSPDASILNIRA
jgi:hypothetical protein